MNFKNGPDIAFSVKDLDKAVSFFKDICDLEAIRKDDYYEVKTKDYNLFLIQGEEFNTVLEFFVDNLDVAKQMCLAIGCKILRWNERDHWLQHPEGFAFHLEERI